MSPDSLTDQQLNTLVLSTPDGYATYKLGIHLHPVQQDVLNSLFSKTRSKVVFRCGNEVGKTMVVCVAAILYAIEILGAKVVSTSATYRQVTKQLIPYLRAHSSKFPSGWEFLENQIKVDGDTRYIGYATTEDAKWQGWHETPDYPLLIIADESAGIKDEIFQSIARCNPTYLLLTGSPLGPEGFFYMACTDPNVSKAFVQHKLNKFDCLKKNGWWLEEKDINDFIAMWTPENPLVLSSVYGEFATNIEGGVITLADIEKCIANPPAFDIEPDKHIALDFAAGGDSNVCVFRNGNDVKLIREWKERDTMVTARQMCEELDRLKVSHNLKPSDVSGDADGLGLPIIHRMRELGWPINEFHGNGTSKDYMCKNLVTDCWINACKKIRNRTLIIPNEQKLKLQLTSRKSFMGQTGKLQLESKDDMRARGIPSPDIADAFCMAVSKCNSGELTFISGGRNIRPPRTQTFF